MAAEESPEKLLRAYLGASFAAFMALLPKVAISHLPNLQARNRSLSLKLIQAEEQIRQMRARRQEDSKANARVVEIFASHRNAWQQEEARLLAQIERATEEAEALRRREAELRAEADRLRREVRERDEVIDFMSRKAEEEDFAEKEVEIGAYAHDPVPEACFFEDAGDFFSPKALHYPGKAYVARRVDGGESAGIAAKLKRLERELGEGESQAAMRKQAKRYSAIAGKAEELCRRMAGDGNSPQRQTEFLVEVFHLQQKLAALAAESGRAAEACFREIQRSLEVWLARIMGDLEGVLARHGLSRVKDYCLSRYPLGHGL
ncbi:ribonuclease P protein subunit P38-like protein [Wolffia australiana]